jgi:hypothetical protein
VCFAEKSLLTNKKTAQALFSISSFHQPKELSTFQSDKNPGRDEI